MERTIRVMVIDDEESARNLLKTVIPWKELNMEVAGEAASGIEAINIIDDVKPDIAFVDITMPFMNGIEFTELATKRYPQLKIIIMTAHDQFEYARKCVSLPVSEYMLKPPVKADIVEILEKMGKEISGSEDKWEDGEKEKEVPQSGNNYTEMIKKFVQDNYTDPKLNLSYVAENFGFSASYLSRKFKQDTGKNFIEYLTDVRMKQAIEYAGNNYKMYQAASKVGIPDPNYFGRCFKKYTGKNYSEYIS